MNNYLIVSLVALVFAVILVGVPVYVSLGLVGLCSLAVHAEVSGTPMAWIVLPQSIYNGIGYSPLLAIPFYMLAGEIMNRGKITDKLVDFALLIIGRMPASLAQANIVASMFFGGITGSAQADTSCIGGILIPAMIKDGYTPEVSVGVTASSSTCGPIIPPSIMMVVYGVTVGASIGALFMGGVIPGLMIGFGLMGMVAIMDKFHHYPRRTGTIPWARKKSIIISAVLPLGMPVIIVGGIMSGVFTPTEAGAAAVVYSLIVSLFVSRTLRFRDIPGMLRTAATLSSTVLMIISCARIFSYGLTALQVSVIVGDLILSITRSPWVFLLLVNLLLLLVGMFMDGAAAVIVLAPILTPIAQNMGISQIHFGLVMVLNLVIGAGTPPLGVCLFIACKIADISVERGVRGILPYVMTEIAILFVVTYIPSLVTYVPILLGYAV
ncbi:MAG: TRAP transporter large permease [Planctomycetota bacterium]|jgi:C4-dicarboxylate transporter DctM subunit|nr:TRAP transporter large permease [Planctomycetota bacterium]